MYHLLNNVDCSHFNPKGRAPMTEDKAAMIYEGKSTLERWVADLISDPDSAFKDMAKLFNGKDVFTVEDLMCFMPEELDRIKPTPAAVSRALANAGAVRSGVLKVGGKSKKLVAVRNREYWRKHQRERKLWADNYLCQLKAGTFGRRTKK